MNAMQANGYDVVQRQTLSGRNLEREVLARVTARLKAADPKDLGSGALLHEALRRNRAVWLAFAADLANPSNEYPDELKASLMSIAGYVEKHTFAAAQNPEIMETFIEINESIISGLGGQPAAQDGAA